jgi:hypothetical protein
MLLTDGSSATEVVQAVRFSRICISCISSREVGKKQSIQVQSLPNQKQRGAVHHNNTSAVLFSEQTMFSSHNKSA